MGVIVIRRLNGRAVSEVTQLILSEFNARGDHAVNLPILFRLIHRTDSARLGLDLELMAFV